MKKTVLTIAIAVLLALSVPLSAFASSTTYFTPTSVEVKQGVSASSSSWADVTSDCVWAANNGGELMIRTLGYNPPLYGIRASFDTPAFVKVQSGYYFIFYYTVKGDLYLSNSVNSSTYFNTYVTDSTGTVHQLSSVISTNGSEFTVTSSGHIGEGTEFSFGRLSFETNLQTGTNTSIFLTMEITTALTPEQERNEQLMNSIKENSQAIIDNQNQNTQDIIDNQNSNTDKILNDNLGYETPEENTANLNAIQTLNSQVNDLNLKVEDVKKTIDEGAENFCSGAEDFGEFINSFLSGLPVALIGLIIGLVIFLVLRKVVGR